MGGWEGAEKGASVFQAMESNSASWTLMGNTVKVGFHKSNERFSKKNGSRISVLKMPIEII